MEPAGKASSRALTASTASRGGGSTPRRRPVSEASSNSRPSRSHKKVETPIGLSTPRMGPTSGDAHDLEAMLRLRAIKCRDSVAFLMGRAPSSSQPPAALQALEGSAPGTEFSSTTRSTHLWEAERTTRDCNQGLHNRRRDYMTEFQSVLRTQEHLIRK
eukprot:TRINITY_DN45442_c0_g1_i1.p1 TRINITY_DN45442_c0_g1~~TRINITY_DN45442_c0_g1_i1.p1  ORF type:complete len:175 (-),score=17.54 TRINITY_DN45442_c0_g1_i1:60-536(-)